MTRTADGGLFGPGSISWRIDREVLVLAGCSCARSAERRLLCANAGR